MFTKFIQNSGFLIVCSLLFLLVVIIIFVVHVIQQKIKEYKRSRVIRDMPKLSKEQEEFITKNSPEITYLTDEDKRFMDEYDREMRDREGRL